MKTNEFTAKNYAKLALGSQVVKLSPESPFIWASGLKSPIYCNNRDLLSVLEDYDRDSIVNGIYESVERFFPDATVVVGVATGAIPWASMFALDAGMKMGYVIAAPKDHGADSNQPAPEEEQARLAKCLIGKFPEDSKVVIVEDLISTGGSSLHAVKAVRAAGYEVAGMIALFSYGFEEAREVFEDAVCEVVTLSDYDTLLEVAADEKFVTTEQLETLKEWRQDHKAWSKAHGGK